MANTYSLDLESGSSQFAYITDAGQTGLDIAGDMTIECWIIPETIGATQVLVSKWNANSTPQHLQYLLYLDTNNKLNFYFATNATTTSNFISDSAVVTAAGSKYHIAISVDVSAPSVEMYVNGVLVADTVLGSSATSIGNDTANFAIGCNYNNSSPTNFFDGLIDDVRMWSDIRTSAEIAAYFQQELVGDETGLVGNWKFENDYLDATSNNNDLTSSGSPVFSTIVPYSNTGFMAIV